MQYFKQFKTFEADVPNPEEKKPEEKTEAPTDKPVEQPAESKPEGDLPSFKTSVTFKNTFNYNKIEINDSFEKTMQDALKKLDEFMKTENKDNKVEVVQVNAQGFASWVPTTYKAKGYDVKNNQVLAADRAKSIALEVKKRVQKYFKEKGIEDVKYVASDITGNVDYNNSQQTFSNFIKNKYNPKSLVEELKKKGAATLKMVKDPTKVTDPQQYLNVNQYGEKHPDNVKTVTVDDAHGQEIFDDMQKSPLYVLYTARLGNEKGKADSVETAYREATQYAVVDISINDPSVSGKEEKKPPVDSNVTLKSITFDKDVDKMDAQGVEADKVLVEYLKNVDVKSIKLLCLVGHAEADDELGKNKFDPNHEDYLKDKAGKKTIMTEKQLADLRFELSISRCKAVYKSIQELPNVKELIAAKSFWMVPVGTAYGGVVKEQRIVQIVVVTKDNKEINTQPEVKMGTDFGSSQIAATFNKLTGDLKYNINKLVAKLLGINSFGAEVPNHLDLAKDVNALMQWHNQYV